MRKVPLDERLGVALPPVRKFAMGSGLQPPRGPRRCLKFELSEALGRSMHPLLATSSRYVTAKLKRSKSAQPQR